MQLSSPHAALMRPDATLTGGADMLADVDETQPGRLPAVALLYCALYLSQMAIPELLALIRGADDLIAYQLDYVGPEPVRAIFSRPILGYFGAIGAVVVGALTFLLARHWRHQPKRQAVLGHVFFVVSCLGIALVENGIFKPYKPIYIGISWICVWITVFPIVVPSPPRKALLVSLVAASMGPVGYVLVVSAGVERSSSVIEFVSFYPIYICALASYFTARVLQRLGDKVREARQLGAYRLETLLGRGGMGEVWTASHRLLQRKAAVKLILPDKLGLGSVGQTQEARRLRARFNREAQATALLGSPHTVELFDFGVAPDGTFYYVMELLEGVDFEGLVERFGPLPPERAVFLLRQVCHSLHDAHSAGLAHRDIKPANLFTCRKGADVDFVKVLDFGLVKTISAAAQRDRDESRLTSEGMPIGTPAFMAPEIAVGESEGDFRSDIYALGCVAFWLLTGRLVFEAETPMKMLIAHAGEAPPRPSERTEVPIPEALDALVVQCLAKDPGDRPPDVASVARRLAEIPFEPHEAWDEERAWKWWRSHLPELLERRPVAQPSTLS